MIEEYVIIKNCLRIFCELFFQREDRWSGNSRRQTSREKSVLRSI